MQRLSFYPSQVLTHRRLVKNIIGDGLKEVLWDFEGDL